MPDDVYTGYTIWGEPIPNGMVSWYDWSIDNWGTKWNAYSIERESPTVVRFDTAWSHPFPVIGAISRKFPHAAITAKYADEDLGYNIDSFTIVNDVVTEDDNLPKPGTEAARDFACNLIYGMTYQAFREQYSK